MVINWQAPAATAYNQATAGNPNGLLHERAFSAENNRILDFQDTVFKELAAAVPELEQWESPDDALLDALSAKRGGQMTDIVRTIQAVQDKIVRMDKDCLLIVQGGPGTGKTAVALHCVSWILFNYHDEVRPQDVLVMGSNPSPGCAGPSLWADGGHGTGKALPSVKIRRRTQRSHGSCTGRCRVTSMSTLVLLLCNRDSLLLLTEA